MTTELNPILSKIVQYVELEEVMKQTDLELKLMGDFEFLPKNKILEAISTAAQDGLVSRFEYQMPGHRYRYFYLPINARLV